MRIIKVLKISLFTFFITFLVGLALFSPKDFYLCGLINCGGINSSLDEVGVLVSFFSAFLFFVAFILLTYFRKRKIFYSWLKFAAVYIPFAAILFFVAPTDNANLYGLDSELIAWFTSGFFFVISLLIIITKWLRARGSRA